ncbi:MAG TPA: hypothetical protein VKP30_32755 [Polyangiaceae bacterium]|nr:hypothetical protein [Polyangiaceae bacterium]
MLKGTKPTMKWRRLGRFVVTVHGAEAPSDEEWTRYVGGADAYQPLGDQRILVVSDGGAPNGTQRQQLIDLLQNARVPTAILTTSWLMRGAGAAVRWFNPDLKVFGPQALQPALDYLQLTEWERSEGVRLVRELQNELGVQVVVCGTGRTESGGLSRRKV